MNILFICNEYPPGKSGGIGSSTRTLARGLQAAGHAVFVAGLYAPGYGQKDYEEDLGVRVWRKRFGIDFGWLKNDYSLMDTLLLKVFKMTGILQRDAAKSALAFHSFLSELIEKFNIDIVEWPDFNEYFSYLPPSFSWPVLRVPLVVKFHGTKSYIEHNMKEKVDPGTYQMEKKHLERADALVSVSRNTADNYTSFYGIDKDIKVLYNSIELSPVTYSAGDPSQTIIFTGTLTPLKGINSLLEAWNLVHAERPGARLRVFGKGNPEVFSPRLSKSAQGSVQFEGFVTRGELYQAMSTAAAAIFPSYTECFAVAPLEAMAVGCPVIYTERVSGPELIQTGVNGILIDPDNYRQIADAILGLLESKELREKFSKNGRQTIEQRFDIRISIKDHIEFYEGLITD